jgi:hypothetical protein
MFWRDLNPRYIAIKIKKIMRRITESELNRLVRRIVENESTDKQDFENKLSQALQNLDEESQNYLYLALSNKIDEWLETNENEESYDWSDF